MALNSIAAAIVTPTEAVRLTAAAASARVAMARSVSGHSPSGWKPVADSTPSVTNRGPLPSQPAVASAICCLAWATLVAIGPEVSGQQRVS